MPQDKAVIPTMADHPRVSIKIDPLTIRETYTYDAPVAVTVYNNGTATASGGTRVGTYKRYGWRLTLRNREAVPRDYWIRVRLWADRDQKVVAEDYVARTNGVEPDIAVRVAFEFDSLADCKKAHLDLIKIVDGKNVSVDEIRPDCLIHDLVWSAMSDSERSKVQFWAMLPGWIVCAVVVVIVCAIIYWCHSVLSCKSDPHMEHVMEPGYCTNGT